MLLNCDGKKQKNFHRLVVDCNQPSRWCKAGQNSIMNAVSVCIFAFSSRFLLASGTRIEHQEQTEGYYLDRSDLSCSVRWFDRMRSKMNIAKSMLPACLFIADFIVIYLFDSIMYIWVVDILHCISQMVNNKLPPVRKLYSSLLMTITSTSEPD